ncbi:F-box/WD repeat-containing protein 8-like [Littorina saxatilis]|uniref:F-box domain-containing protein n=1 Tax=Littorina saxatilis TaxID=31220 RepID=A0AAN9AIJ1_9CAEN
MEDDLVKFRRKWLNELQDNPDTSSDKDTVGDKLQRSNVVPDQANLEKGDDRFHDDAGPVLPAQDQPFEYNANQLQAQQILDQQVDLSATYYPFRILTTLLSRAATEEGPKRVKRRRSGVDLSDKKTGSVTPKRTYFSANDETRGEGNNLPKKTKKEDVAPRELQEKKEGKDYLDLFIADLDEINEIPFFDISVPREVAVKIFWHLDVVDLCRCAQVSKSWCSLAEDELLWCHICHKLGFEKDTLTIQYNNWKSRVRQYSVIKHTLEHNWKNRTGKLHNLHHAKGGVLCSVHSHRSTIVAGYSNCETKMWDVLSGETCIFQPSSTALIIDESEEEGTISNEVLHVATCDKVTAATYSHGFVDVWSNEEGTEPKYTFTCEGSARQPSSLQLWENQNKVFLAISNGPFVQVHTVCNSEGHLKNKVAFDSTVKKTTWLQPTDLAASNSLTATLAIATNYTVNVMAVYDREIASSFDMLELHNIIDAPVTSIDARLDPSEVVVGFTLNTGPAQYFRVNVYDIMTKSISSTLMGHTACVLCVNVAESPPCQVVTGSRDRKVRVYDTRAAQYAMMTLIGHSAAVTTVQMDEWKVVSGDEAGFVSVWDQRMASKLWEMNNRHPVRYCHFDDRELVVAHVPYVKHHYNMFDYDTGLHQRHRGSLHVYDFLANQMTQGVPEICLSSYDEPQGYNYNITLAVPYDQV